MRSLTSARPSWRHFIKSTHQAMWGNLLLIGSSTTSLLRIQEVFNPFYQLFKVVLICIKCLYSDLCDHLNCCWNLDLTTELVYLTPELREDECVSHALALRAAWALGNFHRFFQLYKRAPRMAAYLIDKFVERERMLALRAILKTWATIGQI